jgi:hypothetical protein
MMPFYTRAGLAPPLLLRLISALMTQCMKGVGREGMVLWKDYQ